MYENVMDWLLEKNDSMVRYNTLISLMDQPSWDPEVQKAGSHMMISPPIANIFKKQNEDGGFITPRIVERYGIDEARFGYVPKYKATTWQLSFLAQAGVPCDARIRALCEFIMKNSFNEELGAFGQISRTRKGLQREVMPCLNGRMVWALSTFGFSQRKEVKKSFEFLTTYQRFDDGDFPGGDDWPYSGWSGKYCWGSASCFTGVSEFLRAMTSMPATYWTPAVHEAKKHAIDFMLRHHILHRALKPGSSGVPAKGTHRLAEADWLLRMQAPLILCDAVEILSSLARLGITNSILDESIRSILEKKNARNRWILEDTPSSMYGQWGKKGEENKWITFRILRMLKLTHKFNG